MKNRRILAVIMLFVLILPTPAKAISSHAQSVLSVAAKQIGAPYKLISDAPHSFNCATFVAYCFNQVESGTISSRGINGHYHEISSIRKLKPGDIVCFKISGSAPLNRHLGIYLGKGYFVHASRKAGMVTVSKIKRYKKSFIGGIRVF